MLWYRNIMIKIRYFGFLKETLQLEEEEIPWTEGNSETLLALLKNRDAFWAETLTEENIFRLVVNQKIIYCPTPIHAGDEVAILPPVTGG